MSDEILNNFSEIKNKNTYTRKVDINVLKKKIILRKKKEKLHKNIVLASICVGVTAIGYLVI